MPYLTQKRFKFFELFVRARVVVDKYLENFHLGIGESTGLLRTKWEMSLTYPPKDNLWSISEIVDGERVTWEWVTFLVLSGSLRHFDVLLWKFTNHDNFALTVRYHSLLLFFFLCWGACVFIVFISMLGCLCIYCFFSCYSGND